MAPDQRRIDEAYGVQHIDEAYVRSLADPLVRYMDEPPHDPLTVLAIACRGALFTAWEMITLGEIGLRQDEERAAAGNPSSTGFAMNQHGQIYAGRKVIRDVAETLKLMHPGPLATRGERLYAARTAARLSHEELAQRTGIHRSHVGRIERGDRTLTREVAVLAAGPLGVSPQYLLTGVDPEPEPEPEAGDAT